MFRGGKLDREGSYCCGEGNPTAVSVGVEWEEPDGGTTSPQGAPRSCSFEPVARVQSVLCTTYVHRALVVCT